MKQNIITVAIIFSMFGLVYGLIFYALHTEYNNRIAFEAKCASHGGWVDWHKGGYGYLRFVNYVCFIHLLLLLGLYAL